jgi:hypothetical protein
MEVHLQHSGRTWAIMNSYDTPSGRSRRWGTRRSSQRSMPAYARFVVIALAVLLVGSFLWQFAQRILHPQQKIPVAAAAAATNGPAAPVWQSEVLSALESGARDAGDGNIIPAEVDVDRAATVIAASRAQSQPAPAEFFASAIGKLDRMAATHRDNTRLIEHVTLARIELAQLRTVQVVPADPASSAAAAAAQQPPAGPGVRARHAVEVPGHVVIASPHQISAGQTLDPKTLGGNYLDATLMPDTSEMILPPFTRAFADKVRVENLTMEGASQTLDGIHWKDVTFIGTRLRYEGGELDLQNVHFVRCTFGFTTDERGARIATAIALGQSSVTIQ